jgi:hypothetical protein
VRAGGGGQNIQHPTSNIELEDAGIISLAGQTVRFSRPGLVEEYSVSLDGVRQDFLVPERPADAGELAVRLAVSGARVEPAAAGARLVLDNSGRKLTYSRLRVTDATGRELAARMEVESSLESRRPKAEKSQSLLTSAPTSGTLVVVVNDAVAVYPVRIDPTFSDANWISMGGTLGAHGYVYSSVVDASGNLYIGGDFTVVGGRKANFIAQWNGSSWSPLGSGMGGITEAFMFALGNLSATERAVFILREAFALDYGDIASVVDRSEENCRQILKRARERIVSRESTARPGREQTQRVASEFLNAAETGELEPLLRLLSDEAALARDPGDLTKPVPPLIHDREILFQTLGNSLAQMRNASDRFVLFPLGHDYACVARRGITARGAILLRVIDHKVAVVRLVSCPVLLHQLQILMALSSGGDAQPGSDPHSN